MSTRIAPKPSKPVTIAPAPAGHSTDGNPSRSTKPYSCQTCARRKVKCDRVAPMCSSCRKSNLECFYHAPAPRSQKRRLPRDVLQRLARYELILQQHGLLPNDVHEAPSSSNLETKKDEEASSFRWNDTGSSRTGKLVAHQGKSRYIDSNLWHDLGDGEIEYVSTDEEELGEDDEEVSLEAEGTKRTNGSLDTNSIMDPLSGAFLGSQKSLLQYHPTQVNAMKLWKTHAENVEPICKILHIPSALKILERASNNPSAVTKNEECLLFAIYHFAVFSMNSQQCIENLGQSRSQLMKEYHFATRQALVNASFLRTTEMSVLQALVLFLLSCRYFYDPSTYWILTGVAIRIGQRIGLHRDGEKLGLPPFEVQMRRRLFFQLLPLEGIASQLSGTGITAVPDSWDTLPPLNINDDQIWPGMTEKPEEQRGATDMIFCMARSTVGSFMAKTSGWLQPTGSHQSQGFDEAERVINEAEGAVEEKYIRYCDILNPLHFLTVGSIRSAITAMRLRIRLPKARNNTATDSERKEMFRLAQKILDTDAAAYAHASLGRYMWHVKPFFLWGSWDSLIFTLTSIREIGGWLLPVDIDDAWNRVTQVYTNHPDLLKQKQSLYVAFGRLTLKAWDASRPNKQKDEEPAFITILRSSHKRVIQKREDRQNGMVPGFDEYLEDTVPTVRSLQQGSENIPSDSSLDALMFDEGNVLDVDLSDWVYWDQLVQDYRVQGGQQHEEFSL